MAGVLRNLRSEITRIVGELRLSIFDLRSEVQAQVGLGTALSDYVRAVGVGTTFSVHLVLDEAPERLPIASEAELLRIAQEAITNARKHAAAEHLWVTLRVDPPSAHLRIEDDGRGMGTKRHDSFGLEVMRERAARLGGELTIGSREPHGTFVDVRLGDLPGYRRMPASESGSRDREISTANRTQRCDRIATRHDNVGASVLFRRQEKGSVMVATVLLVDDHELIRQGLRRAFERAEDFSVVAEAGSVAEAVALAKQHQPDVVVVDVRLPDGNGLDVARMLRDQNDDIGIVVLTMYAGDEQLFGALEAGASAFVAKDAPADDVVSAARHAVVSPRSFSASDLAEAMRRRLTPSGPQLSPREREVLQLLADGLGSGRHRTTALYQRVDDEDAHLEAVREARSSQPRASAHVGDAPAADQVSRAAISARPAGRAQ